jgi:hypothetical protein
MRVELRYDKWCLMTIGGFFEQLSRSMNEQECRLKLNYTEL